MRAFKIAGQTTVQSGFGRVVFVLLALAATGRAAVTADDGQPSFSFHSTSTLRGISIFGAQLSMPLKDASAALQKRGLRRDPFKPPSRVSGEAQVLEASYRHPVQNTSVGIFYAALPNGERRVSRIVLWEEVALIEPTMFKRFLTDRYGAVSDVTVFQGHDTYVWSQASSKYSDLLRSVQCLMSCVSANFIQQCDENSISRQVFMSGGYNTNASGKLYLTAELNDLTLQRNAMFGQGKYPTNRPICSKFSY